MHGAETAEPEAGSESIDSENRSSDRVGTDGSAASGNPIEGASYDDSQLISCLAAANADWQQQASNNRLASNLGMGAKYINVCSGWVEWGAWAKCAKPHYNSKEVGG